MTSTPSAAAHEALPLWPAPTPATPVHATLRLPGSKSLTNRALILAGLAGGTSTVRGALRSRDTELMARALTAIGARVDTDGDDWVVRPGTHEGRAHIDCGLAGTVMRFVPPVAALTDAEVTFDGDPHARTRPMRAILDALRSLGIEVDDGGRGALPFTVRGRGRVRGGRVVVDASASSQFVSALLLAGARYDEGIEVVHRGSPVPSMPHIDMTVAALREHGVEVDDHTPDMWRVAPGPVRAVDVDIEPDLSNAAPFLAAGVLTRGSVTVRGWPRRTTQAGDALREILAAMGADVTWSAEGLTVGRSGPLLGVELDLHDVGELTPAVAALAAVATTPSRLYGVAHIRGHETDRITALAAELRSLGGDVVELPDGLEIRPAALHGGTFRTYADHRMAHAAVILGLVVPGVLVKDVGTTAKTYPGFADAWTALVRGTGGA